MTALPSSCWGDRRWPLRSHFLKRIFHYVGHASPPPWLSSTVSVVITWGWSSSSPLFQDGRLRCSHRRPWRPFSIMADVVVPNACRDVTFSRWPTSSLRLLAVPSSPTGGKNFICLLLTLSIGHGERSSDRLQNVLACSGDPPDLIETTSARIWLTSHFGGNWGRHLVGSLPYPSFHKISLLLKVNRSYRYLLHWVGGRPWVHAGGLYRSSVNIAFWFPSGKTWHSSSLSPVFRFPVTWHHQISSALALPSPVVSLTPRLFLPEFRRSKLSAHSGENSPRATMNVLTLTLCSWSYCGFAPRSSACTKRGGYPTLTCG